MFADVDFREDQHENVLSTADDLGVPRVPQPLFRGIFWGCAFSSPFWLLIWSLTR